MTVLYRPRRGLIEAFQRSGLLQNWEHLGSIGRETVWGRVWRGTFDGSLPPRLSRRKPDVIFALMMRNRFLGAILVLEELRVRKRDDAFELVNSVQGTHSSPSILDFIAFSTIASLPGDTQDFGRASSKKEGRYATVHDATG